MKLFFRFNCGEMWGLGHLYRNMTLIREMVRRGYCCLAIINNNEVASNMLLQEHIETAVVNEDESAYDLIDILESEECGQSEKLLFWDRLDSRTPYIKTLVDSGIKIITYDDYDESALLATECIVTRRMPVGGRTPRYMGPEYQILREDVREYALKEKSIFRDVSKILLHFGGTDPMNILNLCFEALKEMNEYQFEYIAGKEQHTDIKDKIEKSCNATYAQGVTDFARRLYEADVCLVAGGVSMYEASAIGTPMINISHNEDQNLAASIFQEKVGSINLGTAKETTAQMIREAVLDICADFEKRKNMSMAMKRFVFPNGTKKVCDIIETIAGQKKEKEHGRYYWGKRGKQ